MWRIRQRGRTQRGDGEEASTSEPGGEQEEEAGMQMSHDFSNILSCKCALLEISINVIKKIIIEFVS